MVTSGKTRRKSRRGTFAATWQGYTGARLHGQRRPPRLKRGTELVAIIRRRRRQEPTDHAFAVTTILCELRWEKAALDDIDR